MKRILSLDGGGIRGALTLGYLQKIEDILGNRTKDPENFRLCQYFDMIGGTSTGSIIAAALSIGMKVDDIREKYFQLGRAIFGDKYDWWKPWETAKFLKAGYNNKPLETYLQEVFGDRTLGSDSIFTNLCVVAKRADTNSTWLLNNNPKGKFFDTELGRNKDIPLWQAVRASTAAPTYFVPQLLEVGNDVTGAFVDGGVSLSNNPAFDLFKMATIKGYNYNWAVGEHEIFVVSVGTGNAEYFAKTSEITDKWLLQWAAAVPNMLMADASWGNQTMLQWLGKCLTPKEIDMEIGDLSDDCLTKEPLLTYSRFNSVMSTRYLNQLGLGPFSEEEVESLQEMSNAENCERLYQIGEAAAQKEVEGVHFPLEFDKDNLLAETP